MAEPERRPTFDVPAASGGWPYPWPNVAEIARVLPSSCRTLVGGLMTQLHTIHHGIDAVRPTNDVDIALHIETTRGTPNAAADALEALGYALKDNIDPRNNVGHRFVRDEVSIDLVGAGGSRGGADDVVDVVVADHAAPRVTERMRRRELVRIPGGTQALRRTANYRLAIEGNAITTISVPQPFGALVLKAAAYAADSRDRERHLYDAAVLLACIRDPLEDRRTFAGSDRSRLLLLRRELGPQHRSWLRMPAGHAARGQAVLRALCVPG